MTASIRVHSPQNGDFRNDAASDSRRFREGLLLVVERTWEFLLKSVIRRLYQFRPLFERSERVPLENTEINDETYVPRASVILWNRETFEEDPPEVTFEEFMSQRSGLKQVLKNVTKFGFCIMKGESIQSAPLEYDKISRLPSDQHASRNLSGLLSDIC